MAGLPFLLWYLIEDCNNFTVQKYKLVKTASMIKKHKSENEVKLRKKPRLQPPPNKSPIVRRLNQTPMPSQCKLMMTYMPMPPNLMHQQVKFSLNLARLLVFMLSKKWMSKKYHLKRLLVLSASNTKSRYQRQVNKS